METQIDPARMAAWRAFQWTNTVVMRTLEKELEADGMPLTWFDVLIHLREAPDGRMRMQELAESVVLSRSGATRVIDRMVAEGLVRREASTEDRRGAYAVITERGCEAFEGVLPGHERSVQKHFTALLASEDVPVLYSILARIIAANEGPGSSYAKANP